MTGAEELPLLDREEIRVTVEDGLPVLELPNGQVLRLRVHVTEFSHDRPVWGEGVEMDVEVDYDDYAWWTLYPERTEHTAGKKHLDFPTVSIEPEVLNPDEQEAP